MKLFLVTNSLYLFTFQFFLANSLIKINVGKKGVEIEVGDDEILK